MSGILYNPPPARASQMLRATGPVAAAAAPGSFEAIERALDVNAPGGGPFELALGTTVGAWGGVDVYVAPPRLSSGLLATLQVSVYAIAFGMRTLVGSGFFDNMASASLTSPQRVASVRGLAGRFEVVLGAHGDGLTDTVGQIQAAAIASNAVTPPADGAGVIRGAVYGTPFTSRVTRPARAYAVRARAPAGVAALQLVDSAVSPGVPNGTRVLWSQTVAPNDIVSMVPPEWAQMFLATPRLVWSTINQPVTVGAADLLGTEWSLR